MSVVVDDKGKKKFDLRVHVMEPKTGKVIKVQPYRKHVMGPRGQSIEIFERGGKFFWENGEEAPSPAAYRAAQNAVPAAAAPAPEAKAQVSAPPAPAAPAKR